MSTTQNKGCKPNCLPDATPKVLSEERVKGYMENIFGLKIPSAPAFETEEDQHFAGVLENVFGVRLPSEMVARAYTIFIKEYQ